MTSVQNDVSWWTHTGAPSRQRLRNNVRLAYTVGPTGDTTRVRPDGETVSGAADTGQPFTARYVRGRRACCAAANGELDACNSRRKRLNGHCTAQGRGTRDLLSRRCCCCNGDTRSPWTDGGDGTREKTVSRTVGGVKMGNEAAARHVRERHAVLRNDRITRSRVACRCHGFTRTWLVIVRNAYRQYPPTGTVRTE